MEGWRDERPATAEHSQLRAGAVPAYRGGRELMPDWGGSGEGMCIFLIRILCTWRFFFFSTECAVGVCLHTFKGRNQKLCACYYVEVLKTSKKSFIIRRRRWKFTSFTTSSSVSDAQQEKKIWLMIETNSRAEELTNVSWLCWFRCGRNPSSTSYYHQ